ncbi:MAG: TonB-dependent receptor [Acidobacteria bacterium]|nr:TonB-dependent receptor [Acidobacteriota bacterium]
MSGTCVRWLLPLALTLASEAQQKDLASLTLEDFLNVEVTSVDKGPRKLSRTPAAVFVITQDDIRRSGAANLPEVLRMAPGVTVAQISGGAWAISIRGFSNLYSNKLLVMVDGRTIYSALLSGTIWGEELVMLEDIERIEVIRGPGAAMWGANAVSGVINIITRGAKATQGGLVSISGGGYNRLRTAFRYGGSMGTAGAWRGWAQYTESGQPVVPGLAPLPPWPSVRGGLRLEQDLGDRDSLLIEGEFARSTPKAPFVYAATAGANSTALLENKSSTGYLMGRWRHVTRRGDESNVQVFYNDEAIDAAIFSSRVRTLDVDWNQTHALGRRHLLRFGAGARANMIDTRGTGAFGFDPAGGDYGILNAFAQDEWELSPGKWMLTLGGKIERYQKAGVALQPEARLMWTPCPRFGYWISASRAVRTPAHTDYAVRFPVVYPGAPFTIEMSGSPDLKPEVLKAMETGVRLHLGRAWAIDLAGFRHRYTDIDSYQIRSITAADLAAAAAGLMPTISAWATNSRTGWNTGYEAVAMYQFRPNWQVSGSYSNLIEARRLKPGINPISIVSFGSYSPAHQGQIRSSWDFARRWSSDVTWRRVGELTCGALPAHSSVDFRIARRLGESAEFSVSGQNLLRPRQFEFVGSQLYPAGEVRRSIQAAVRWSF